MPLSLRTVNVTRYITPLREGGSLPAIAEADDGFLYVLKFRGAGQGKKALIAELIGGEIARALGLKVPELVFANLDAAFGQTEGDEEIQDLLKASQGLNLALHYLSGSITFDPVVTTIDAALASKIVWLDYFISNMDRTVRNTNMLLWYRELWLIDHGAALYFHHSGRDWKGEGTKPFELIKNHVLLASADQIEKAGEECRTLLKPDILAEIVDLVPDEWLLGDSIYTTAAENRQAYKFYLETRVTHNFDNEIIHARQALI
jgi:hypothetical protein